MIVKHCKIIQEKGCALFYSYNRELKGYEISGLIIAPTRKAKLAFKKVWQYFISDIVQEDDIYCSFFNKSKNWIFTKCVEYYTTINNTDIYKITRKE